jgi:hypothetical protein
MYIEIVAPSFVQVAVADEDAILRNVFGKVHSRSKKRLHLALRHLSNHFVMALPLCLRLIISVRGCSEARSRVGKLYSKIEIKPTEGRAAL